MALLESQRPIEYVYFSLTGLISTDALTSSGESVEVGVIGREGFAGLAGLFGDSQMQPSGQGPGGADAGALVADLARPERERVADVDAGVPGADAGVKTVDGDGGGGCAAAA